MHEVVHDLGAVERATRRDAIGRIRSDPLDIARNAHRRPPRHADHLVLRRERLDERTPEEILGYDEHGLSR